MINTVIVCPHCSKMQPFQYDETYRYAAEIIDEYLKDFLEGHECVPEEN